MKQKLFIVSIILLLLYSLIYLKPELSTWFILAQVIAVIILAILLLFQYAQKGNPIKSYNYVTLLFFIGIFMFFMMLIYSIFNVGNYSVNTVVQDLMALVVLGSGFIFAKNLKHSKKFLIKYLKILGVMAIVSGIISFSYADFSGSRDDNVWQPQYIWWGLLFPWSYLMLYKFIIGDKSIFWTVVSYGSTIMYIVLGLLFEKRIVLFELVVILILILIATQKKTFLIKIFKKGIFSLIIIFLIVIASQKFLNFNFLDLFSDTWLRFTNDSIQEFDRLNEFTNIFEEYPYSIIITGAGLGSYHHGPGGINLHIGWLNYIFKGGILFFALELWVLSLAIKALFKSQNVWAKYISASVVFIYVDIIIVSSWLATPLMLNFSIMKFALLTILEEIEANNSGVVKESAEGNI